MMKYALITGFTIFSALSWSAIVEAQDILSLLKAKTVSEQVNVPPAIFPYKYVVDYVSNQKQGDDVSHFSARYQVDPNAEPGSRVTILKSSGDAENDNEDFNSTLQELENIETTKEDIASELWCNDDDRDDAKDKEKQLKLIQLIEDGRIKIESETDQNAVLEMSLKDVIDIFGDDLDLGEIEGGESSGAIKKIIKRMKLQMHLTKPDVRLSKMRIWLNKPMRIMIVARIKEMDMTMSCDLAPNGYYYRSRQNLMMEMSALGSKFNTDSSQTIIELIPN